MENKCVEIWNECLKVIKDNTHAQSFSTWFEPIKPLEYKDNVLTLQVPSQFFYEYLETHYIDLLRKTIKKVLGEYGLLVYSIVMDADRPFDIRVPSNDRTNTINPTVKMPLDFAKEAEKEVVNPFVLPGINKIKVESQLNENYSFENFVEGDCNRLARAAGLAIAERPGKTAFNPLFIFSPTGLGKTHLCQAIGLETKKHFPNLIVLYVHAEQFIQQFMSACKPGGKNDSRNDFVHFYQMIDVLIVDDIQFLAGKTKTLDAFFHIFNHLQQNDKQLIFTCDKPPAELKDMDPRLISRFKWGLSADLQMPDNETRKNILKRKAYNEGIVIPEEVIDYLALHVKTNIREMEGLLISLIAQASLNKKTITIELAKQMIDRFVNNTTKELSVEYIVNTVCESMGVSTDDFNAKTRKREIVQARQLAMHFAKKYTKASLTIIGQQCGGKDHATVLHAIKTVKNLLETDREFAAMANEIDKNIC